MLHARRIRSVSPVVPQLLTGMCASALPKQDQYLEVTTPVPAEDVLFGAGEHISATGAAALRMHPLPPCTSLGS